MKNSKEWFSVSELLSEKLNGLPSTDKGISKKAEREGWKKQQRTGVKGKTFEYHYTSLPEDVQKQLRQKGLIAAFGVLPVVGSVVGGIIGAAASYAIKENEPLYDNAKKNDDDSVEVSKRRFLTAIQTLEEILKITHKTMTPEAKAQMVWMIYELLSEESANEKIIEMMKLVA